MKMFRIQLRILREKAGLSQAALAKKLGINQSAVAAWEAGRNKPENTKLEALANIFGVSTDYLLGRESTHSNRIPVLGTIPAGVPLEAIEGVLDYEELPESMFSGGKEYFALKIRGDSMLPRYENGDVVILRKQESCESGQDCAVLVDGNDATFKRVRVNENSLTLQPLNPAYEPMVYTTKEVAELPVRILGVAVEIRRTV